jgi:hypothetical protein
VYAIFTFTTSRAMGFEEGEKEGNKRENGRKGGGGMREHVYETGAGSG